MDFLFYFIFLEFWRSKHVFRERKEKKINPRKYLCFWENKLLIEGYMLCYYFSIWSEIVFIWDLLARNNQLINRKNERIKRTSSGFQSSWSADYTQILYETECSRSSSKYGSNSPITSQPRKKTRDSWDPLQWRRCWYASELCFPQSQKALLM